MPLLSGLNNRSHWKAFKNLSLLGSGPLYFYAGAGLSQAAGLVSWKEMAGILWHYLNQYEGLDKKRGWWRAFPKDNAKGNARLLDGFVNKAFRGETALGSALSRGNSDPRVFGRIALLNTLLRYRKPKTDWSRRRARPQSNDEPDRLRCGKQPLAEDLVLHSLIWRAKCHGVLTPNYDMLLEHAYSLFDHGAALRSYRYNADFLRYIMSNPRFVLKLHGDINDVSTMLFDPQTAWGRGKPLADGSRPSRGHDLKEVYKTALESGHMVYVGMGFRDRTIRELHEHWRQPGKSNYVRIALIDEQDVPSIKKANADANFKTKNYNDIVFLTYQRPESPSETVREFLSRIVDTRAGAQITSVKRPECEEAGDIHEQVFLTKRKKRLVQHWRTEPRTCKGVPK